MIFCVEDDEAIRGLMIYTLQAAGFETQGFSDGAALFRALETQQPALILLDIMLPGEDGISVLKKLRTQASTAGLHVIMAPARGAEYDKVTGLDLGADDYLVKPFHIPELLARIRALIRRPAEIRQETCTCFSDLSFNQTEHILSCGTNSLLLTARESEVLSVLISHPQSLISRDQLIYKIWGTDTDIVPRNVDNYISFLRKRLREIGSGCEIKTVYGSGYKLEGKNAGAFI